MATALRRCGLEPGLLQNLQRHGFSSAKDVLETHPVVLMERLDVPEDTVDRLRGIVARKCMPSPSTAMQLHKKSAARARKLPSYLQALDDLLGGGISPGCITELVGPAGIGKSQLCLMLAISSMLPHISTTPPTAGCVLFIDSERRFSSQRLLQIAAGRWPQAFGQASARNELASRIRVVRALTPADLLARLQGLEMAVIEHSVRLVVVDSIAVLARADAAASLQERQALLGQQAAVLKKVAETFAIPVVVTNQVTSGGQAAGMAFTGERPSAAVSEAGEPQLVAALGTLWGHAVNTRLVLESRHSCRIVKVAKSPAVPAAAAAFEITAAGLEEAAQSADAVTSPGRGIRNEVDYMA